MNIKTYSLPQLQEMHINKGELTCMMGLNAIPGIEYDCAIPGDWLKQFQSLSNSQFDPDTITSTTFWVYLKGDSIGHPVSGCTEVQTLIDWYNL
jgi:hypothetical protein